VFFIELFTEGVVVIQKYIIPTAWQTGYERLLDDYMTSIKQIIGGGGVAVLLRSIVVVAFVPALSEEMFFRGFLQTSLEYSVRIIYAIVFTSFLFAAMHLNPILFIPLFVAGLFFGFISYLSSSIIVPFILHFVMNFLGIIEVFYQTDSGTAGQEALSLTTASVLFVVGITGISVISYLLYKMKRDIKTSLQS
jgi:membrane protease YdiL (CAAX protease family)